MTTAPKSPSLGPRSLSGRLLLGSAFATLVTLALLLALMHQVLSRFVTGQIDQRLDNKIVALASQVRVASDGTIALVGQADGPPFDERHHRSFWIIRGPQNTLMSNWLSSADAVFPPADELDIALAGPAPRGPGPGGLSTHPRTLEREGIGVRLHERIVRTTIDGTGVIILVAAPTSSIADPVAEAMTTVGIGALTLGIVLGALAFAQVRLGLRPLEKLREQLAEVGDGRRNSLPGTQPYEVTPLVFEINGLLERNAVNLHKARRHVANLAHSLKTPLATLQLGFERLEGPGKSEMRRLLEEVDLRIRHHLGRARVGVLAGPQRSRSLTKPHLANLCDAIRRIHADRNVTLTLDCPDGLAVACEANDVDEIFGNLLDNAFKFARGHVACAVRQEGNQVLIEIADDGTGLNPEQISVVLQAGERLDENVPGFGFGLTIARELIELYGGELLLHPSTSGSGLVATAILPLGGARL